jgi:hypothetical protein
MMHISKRIIVFRVHKDQGRGGVKYIRAIIFPQFNHYFF